MASDSIRRRSPGRTSAFVAGGVVLTLGLSGCGGSTYYVADGESVAVCVDERTGTIVDDDQCDDDGGGGHGGIFSHRYYGKGSYVPRTGERIGANGATPTTSAAPGTKVVKSGTISRGGFGSGKGGVGG